MHMGEHGYAHEKSTTAGSRLERNLDPFSSMPSSLLDMGPVPRRKRRLTQDPRLSARCLRARRQRYLGVRQRLLQYGDRCGGVGLAFGHGESDEGRRVVMPLGSLTPKGVPFVVVAERGAV